jgi:predicted enzyme related to lactoylglutathione lyase
MAAKKSARKKPVPKQSASKKSLSKKTAAKKPAAKKLAAKRSAVTAKRSAVTAKRSAVKRSAANGSVPAPPQPTGPRVVHWEVQAADLARQQTFFADLFGWTVDTNNPMNYGMVKAGGQDAIGGGIGGTMDSTSRVTVYVQVPDINAALAKAEALGAKTVMPRMDMGMIVMGQFSDLEGNVIGLVEGS